jgi:hypothetical protein
MDYAAHDEFPDVAIGASIVPASQVAKRFTTRISKDYVVIEVALYPRNGQPTDLHTSDFALNSGTDSRNYPATSQEVAWHGQRPPRPAAQGTHVVAEAGVEFGARTNPATGKTEHGAAAYGGAGVDNRPPTPAAPDPANDPDAVEGRLLRMALPEGQIDRPSAGYLYFPRPTKAANGAVRLECSHNGERKELALSTK